eukprot:CAMPEP_0179193356 /NCGR_PEP_ID=MMETSP0796-20121207/96084_1 /TAXON_ID=73915 /ORGANISM="Pyrodinium bahamense, Strain pbaha01" /LENGTH=33 /DNA_ID= /DNA_START= /DNA_END= /DNA_ORIENTATION=
MTAALNSNMSRKVVGTDWFMMMFAPKSLALWAP